MSAIKVLAENLRAVANMASGSEYPEALVATLTTAADRQVGITHAKELITSEARRRGDTALLVEIAKL